MPIKKRTGSEERRPQSDGLGPECFTARPSAERARALNTSYKNRTRERFLAAIDSAADGLKLDLAHVGARVHQLDPELSFSPYVFVACATLSRLLQSGNVTDVMDCLKGVQVSSAENFAATALRIQSALTEPWEVSFVQAARNESADGSNPNDKVLRPLLESDPSHRFTPVFAALEYLKELDPELASEFYEYVTRVKLFNGRGYLGLSSPLAFGAIYLRLPKENLTEYYLEHLVHELSYLDFVLLMAHDPLIENPLERHGITQGRQRSLFELLQATHVIGRKVRLLRGVVGAGSELDFEERLSDLEEEYSAAHGVVASKAMLTERGQRLFESMELPTS